jgi:uncharacterized coiled-coil protein SlyX
MAVEPTEVDAMQGLANEITRDILDVQGALEARVTPLEKEVVCLRSTNAHLTAEMVRSQNEIARLTEQVAALTDAVLRSGGGGIGNDEPRNPPPSYGAPTPVLGRIWECPTPSERPACADPLNGSCSVKSTAAVAKMDRQTASEAASVRNAVVRVCSLADFLRPRRRTPLWIERSASAGSIPPLFSLAHGAQEELSADGPAGSGPMYLQPRSHFHAGL